MYNRITINLKSAVRHETLEGREYLVAPIAMLTEGVHEGSMGPKYYPKDELTKNLNGWDHKPIVVYHPEMNGQAISACEPTILDSRKIGIMLNTKFDGKLRTEGWFEKEATKRVDPRVYDALTTNKMMEVSTGLFVDEEKTEGEWNGEKYGTIARNYRPDHLAILPDKIGACSIADGAGLLQLNEQMTPKVLEEVMRRAVTQAMKVTGVFATNDVSFDQRRRAIYGLLSSAYGEPGKYWDGYIEDVFPDFVVYCTTDGKLYKQDYTVSGTDVQLSGDPIQVVRVTEYREAGSSSYVGNAAGSLVVNGDETMDVFDKKAAVDGLIAGGGWVEGERTWLTSLEDDKLKKLVGNGKKEASQKEEKPAATTVAPPPAPVAANAAPVVTTPLTVDQYIANAPPGVRDMLTSGLVAHNAEKDRLVGVITANANNPFTKEFLATKDLNELRGLAAIAAPANNGQVVMFQGAPNFLGAAGVAPTVNNTPMPDPLAMPTIDFTKK